MLNKLKLGLVFCTVLLNAGMPLRAAEALQISQEKFADTHEVADHELVLMGAALKRFQVLKAVAVAFYAKKGVSEEEILTPIPKRIEVALLQKISRDELVQEAVKGLKDNLSPDDFAAIDADIQKFSSWFRDGEAGDRYAVTYIPGIGTKFELNGVEQGVIEAEDFATGYFSSYVGAKPADPRAKGKLLGRLEFNK